MMNEADEIQAAEALEESPVESRVPDYRSPKKDRITPITTISPTI